MSRIDWLLKGDPIFTMTSSTALAIRVRAIVKLERQYIEYVPGSGTVYLPTSKDVQPLIGPPSEYRYLGQRAVMP